MAQLECKKQTIRASQGGEVANASISKLFISHVLSPSWAYALSSFSFAPWEVCSGQKSLFKRQETFQERSPRLMSIPLNCQSLGLYSPLAGTLRSLSSAQGGVYRVLSRIPDEMMYAFGVPVSFGHSPGWTFGEEARHAVSTPWSFGVLFECSSCVFDVGGSSEWFQVGQQQLQSSACEEGDAPQI